ncbi:MAG: RNA polymerase sigma factor [Chitinophagaceae bacterium]
MFNEKEDIPRILNGDLKVFGSLVKQYQQLVFYVVDKLIKGKDDKEDVSQEVFIKVYKNLDSFKFKSKLSTWIASIAYRTAINYIRDHVKGREVQYEKEVEDFYFTSVNPGKLSEKKDIAAYIHSLIGEMPIQYKSVLTLYHLNEFSYEEIEQITGMPEGTVKSYLFRARKLLKDKLKPYFKDEYSKRPS